MASKTSIEAGKGHVSLGVDDGPLQRGLNAARDKFRQWGASLGVIGRNMATLGAGMLGSLSPSVAIFANYEQSLADLRAAANPTAVEMARLREQIEAVGRATGTDFNDVTKAYSELLKAGVSLETVLGGMGEAVVKFSRVAGMELGQTATVLVNAMNMFSREGLNASQVANIMNQAADASTISLRDVSDAFANGGGVAATFGQNIRDTATAIAIFGNNGIAGAEAGTTLRTILMRLTTGTEGAAAAIAELGLNLRDSGGNMRPIIDIIGQLDRALAGRGGADRDRLLAELGGAYGIRGLTTLLASGTAGWDRMQAAMMGSLTVEQKFDLMTSTLLGTLKKLWVHVQGVAVAVGEALQPALSVVGTMLAPMLTLFEAFVRENQVAIQIFAAVAVALITIGGALMVMGGSLLVLAPAFGALASAIAGIGTAIAWVPTLILWSDYLRYSILGVTGVFRMFGVQMRDIWEPLGVVDDLFDSLFNTIAGFASGTIFEQMGQSISRMWVELLASPVGEFAKQIAIIAVGFIAIQAALAGAVVYIAYFITSRWIGMWIEAARYLGPLIESLFSIWLEGIGYISQAFESLFAPVLSLGRGVLSTVQTIYTAASAAMATAWATTVSEFGRLAESLTATAGTAFDGIRAAFNNGDWAGMWDIVVAAAQLAWAQINSSVTVIWNGWKDALTDTFTEATVAIKSVFISLWGEVKSVAFAALAEIASGLASVSIGPVATALNAQAARFRQQSTNATLVAAAQVANLGSDNIGDWFTEQNLRVERDTAAAAGNTAGVNRAQAALDRLVQMQLDNEMVRFWEATEGDEPSVVARGGPAGPDGSGGGARSMTMGAFGANAMLLQGGSSATPEMRAARAAERSAVLLAEAVAALLALREEVAPRFA